MAWDIERATGQAVGDTYQITRLESSVFTRPGKISSIEFARLPISALLVGGLGVNPPSIYGLLHPSPRLPFDPAILARLAFCKQHLDFGSGTISTEWVQKTDPMYARDFE
jgi:hypothetical protein